jgi:5'-methylthioadenosine phosphorylase
MYKDKVEIGVFGGSGFYSLLGEIDDEVAVDTPYGSPSSRVSIATIKGRKVAFLPRHGSKHQFPPHMINYRANLWAMKSLGVRQLIGPCASGSLQPQIKPGDFVLCDQFVDRTKGRPDTFYNGPVATHVSSAEPYCPKLREIAYQVISDIGIKVHKSGTVVVIQGPRFSTKAESRWFSSQGWEVINMTQYPEVHLARELEICYLNISLITDWDVGLEGHPEIKPVTADEVVSIFKENNQKLSRVIAELVPRLPRERHCLCASALKGSRLEA